MEETQVQSLGQKDPLEEDMAPHSSILAWGIPWTEEPGGLQSMGSQRVTRLKQLSTHAQQCVCSVTSKHVNTCTYVDTHLHVPVLSCGLEMLTTLWLS